MNIADMCTCIWQVNEVTNMPVKNIDFVICTILTRKHMILDLFINLLGKVQNKTKISGENLQSSLHFYFS